MDDAPFQDNLPPAGTSRSGAARWGPWIVLFAMIGLYVVATRPRASAVAWAGDLPHALAEAGKTRQPILVEFHTPWCSVCEWMDREVFPRREVAQSLTGWTPVRVDGDQHPELTRRYAVDGYPTFLALRTDGQVIRREAGGMDPGEFVAFIRGAESEIAAPATQPTSK